MKTYTALITVITFLLCHSHVLYAQSELADFRQLQNRVTVHHDDGGKEIFMVTDQEVKPKADRLYHWYRAQKVHGTQGGYSGKLLHGLYSLQTVSGNLIIQGQYKKGLAHGLWKTWRDNNRLDKEEHWKNGEITGTCAYYDEQGRLLLQGKKAHGVWEGKVWTWVPADSSYQWTYYAHGNSISKEAYSHSTIFRRTGSFFHNLWNSVFRKAPDTTSTNP